jgi:anti-sigma B factor antagonist
MVSIDTVLVDDRTAVVVVEGELDLWSAPQLRRTLRELLVTGRKRLVLDLAGVRFMDSTALGVLVGIDRRLESDQRVAIAQAGPEALRVLELSGVAARFRIFPTREMALNYVTLDHAERPPASAPALTADAALLLGIASTAMPFAESLEEQAERWLHALRRHGEAGAVLAALGVGEAPVGRLEHSSAGDLLRFGEADAVAIVTQQAGHIAAERGARKLATTDVLLAVIHVYATTFERVLAAHGVDATELTARLDTDEPTGAESQV